MADTRSQNERPLLSSSKGAGPDSFDETDFPPSSVDSHPHSLQFPGPNRTMDSRDDFVSLDPHSQSIDAYGSMPEDETPNDTKPSPTFCPRPHVWVWHWVRTLISFIAFKLRSLTRRWLIGVGILLVVNFIWAASSIAVQAVFTGFDKPFFLTFFSTSLFSLFLSGFLFLKSWRDNDRIAEEMARDAALRAAEESALLSHSEESSINAASDDNMRTRGEGDLRPRRRKVLNGSPTTVAEPAELYGDIRNSGGLSVGSDPHSNVSVEKKVRLRNFASPSDDEWSDASTSTSSIAADASDSKSELNNLLPRDMEERAGADASESTGESTEKKEIVPIFPVKRVAILALQFLPIWFIANATFNWSLRGTSVTSNSIISTTSSFWTLLFCHLFKVERFTILRSIALAVTLGGVIVVAFSDEKSGKDSLIGDILAVVSAICYGLYASFLRIRIEDETQVKMPMFFGFVGFFNMILMWPFFFILHYSGVERFELPSLYNLLILTANGLVGTVLSDLLWSLVIFLTSATVATVGLSLNVPFSLLLDLVIKHRKFSVPYYFGAFVVLIGFFVANLSS